MIRYNSNSLLTQIKNSLEILRVQLPENARINLTFETDLEDKSYRSFLKVLCDKKSITAEGRSPHAGLAMRRSINSLWVKLHGEIRSKHHKDKRASFYFIKAA